MPKEEPDAVKAEPVFGSSLESTVGKPPCFFSGTSAPTSEGIWQRLGTSPFIPLPTAHETQPKRKPVCRGSSPEDISGTDAEDEDEDEDMVAGDMDVDEDMTDGNGKVRGTGRLFLPPSQPLLPSCGLPSQWCDLIILPHRNSPCLRQGLRLTSMPVADASQESEMEVAELLLEMSSTDVSR